MRCEAARSSAVPAGSTTSNPAAFASRPSAIQWSSGQRFEARLAACRKTVYGACGAHVGGVGGAPSP
jgi:hypothetical protein